MGPSCGGDHKLILSVWDRTTPCWKRERGTGQTEQESGAPHGTEIVWRTSQLVSSPPPTRSTASPHLQTWRGKDGKRQVRINKVETSRDPVHCTSPSTYFTLSLHTSVRNSSCLLQQLLPLVLPYFHFHTFSVLCSVFMKPLILSFRAYSKHFLSSPHSLSS